MKKTKKSDLPQELPIQDSAQPTKVEQNHNKTPAYFTFCLLVLGFVASWGLYSVFRQAQQAILAGKNMDGIALRLSSIWVTALLLWFGHLLFRLESRKFPVKRIKAVIAIIRDGNYYPDIPSMHDHKEAKEVAAAISQMTNHIATRDVLKVEKIASEKSRFATLANLLDAPIFLINADNNVAFANDKFFEMFNTTWEDVYESEFSNIALPPLLTQKLQECIAEKNWLWEEPLDFIGDNYAYELCITLKPVKTTSGAAESVICILERIKAISHTKTSTTSSLKQA